MLSSNPIDIMLAFDPWATRLLLNLCRPLSHDQFHQRFDIGLGSLHDTFTHIVSVMRRWTDRLAGRPVRAMLHALPEYPHLAGESKDRTVSDLLALLEEAERDLNTTVAAIRERGLSDTVQLDWPAESGSIKRYTFSKGAVLVHLCTHGSHHRSQCLNMLRRLNIPGLSDRLPDPSVADWQADVEAPPIGV